MVKSKGFTLIEVIVVVAIVAVLAAIAVPSYARYVTKGVANSGAGDVYSLSLAMENMYQRRLSYKSTPDIKNDKIVEYTNKMWRPTQADNFDFALTVNTVTASFKVTATGKSGTSVDGCILTYHSLINKAPMSSSRSVTVTDPDKCGGFDG